jgi:hypothetical protein
MVPTPWRTYHPPRQPTLAPAQSPRYPNFAKGANMNRLKLTVGLMIFLGVMDLAIVPLMVHQNSVSTDGTPPVPAIVVQVIIGVLTLVACVGIPAGKRWARRTAIVTRVLDGLSGLLGIGAHVSTTLKAGGVVTFVLSIVLITLLAVRTNRFAGAPSRLTA